jgi:hypothetical protein
MGKKILRRKLPFTPDLFQMKKCWEKFLYFLCQCIMKVLVEIDEKLTFLMDDTVQNVMLDCITHQNGNYSCMTTFLGS